LAHPERSAKAGNRLELGVDIGGTFTDVVLVRGSGRIRTAKVLTTPHDPERAVLEGIGKVLREEAASADRVARLVHATTLATNAIVERKGCRTAMVTTAGFRDVLETRNELRYDLYDLFLDLPPAVVPRALRIPVTERVRYDGKVVQAPEPEELEEIARHLVSEHVESVAVCLIHAYANPENEHLVAATLRKQIPRLAVSLSSEVLPEIGEYGRFSTTTINAYVQPLVARYLERLAGALERDGFTGMFTVMASSGGTMPLAAAERFPVRLVESGPAAGVHAASAAGVALQIPRLLSLDIGGTTAKMCVIQDGRANWTTDFEVARLSRFKKGSGLTLKVPSLDLIEIGAGGGSIARVNALGLIEVGPDSAGADPGPAAYGLGGGFATVTDADLLLGYLNPDNFLGGQMRLDPVAAERAVMSAIGTPLGMDVRRAAYGISSSADMRFAGQRSEVNVPLRRTQLSSARAGAVERSFRAVYGARYGRDVPEVKPEFVNLRVTVRGPDHRGRLRHSVARSGAGGGVPSSRRPMLFDPRRGLVECPAFERAAVAAGQRITGPAVVEDRDSTAVVPPRWTASLDRLGNLVLTR
jgi:N-methylhydantoinase A